MQKGPALREPPPLVPKHASGGVGHDCEGLKKILRRTFRL